LTLAAQGISDLKRGDFSEKYQGAPYIVVGVCNFQRWTLTDLQPGKRYIYSLVPARIFGELPGQPFRLLMSAQGGIKDFSEMLEIVVSSQNAKKPLQIPFVAASDQAVLLLSYLYRRPKFHYLSLAEISLQPDLFLTAFLAILKKSNVAHANSTVSKSSIEKIKEAVGSPRMALSKRVMGNQVLKAFLAAEETGIR
jgi:hypothetical protein